MSDPKHVIPPIGYQCDNCKWIHHASVAGKMGSWYEERDGIKGTFWVCPNCERAEKELREKLN